MATTTRTTLFDCSHELRAYENYYQYFSNGGDTVFNHFDTYYSLSDDSDSDDDDLEYEYQIEYGFISCLDIDFYIFDDELENFDDDLEWQFFLDNYGERIFSTLMELESSIYCCHGSIDDEEEEIDFWCQKCMEKNVLNWKRGLLSIIRSIECIQEELNIDYPHITIPLSEEFFFYCYNNNILKDLYNCGTRNHIILMLSGDVEVNPGPQRNQDAIIIEAYITALYILFCAIYIINIFVNLLVCGDIESNPGPVMSRPIIPCNNNPKGELLENEILQIIKKLMFRLRSYEKKINPEGIHPQAWNDVPEGVKKINDFIEKVLPNMYSNAFGGVASLLKGLNVIKEELILLTVIILLVVLFMHISAYRLAIVTILSFLCYHYAFPSEVLSIVKDLQKNIIEIQGIEDFIYNPMFSICGKLLLIATSFVAVKSIPGKKDWDSFMIRLDRLPKAKEGAEKIADYAISMWNLVYDQIKMIVLGKTQEELRTCNEIYHRIDEWAQNVRKYIELEERNKIDGNLETANFVEQLYIQGLEFQKETNLSRDALRVIGTHMLPAKHLYEYVSLSPVKGGGPRMKPLCIWLVGSSQIGKTEMVYPLCIDLLREMGLIGKQIFHNQVYPRQVETEYFDGYNQQKIVIYDDAFQKKDDKVNGNLEIFEVIRSCNTFPQHLHMAAISEKNTFSKAEVLIYTTNQSHVQLESITHPEAFYNRMYENAYIVKPKLEYAKSRIDGGGNTILSLDQSKLSQENAIDLNVYSFQQIIRDECGNIINIGEAIDYDTFSSRMCKDWKSRKERSISKLKFLEEYAIRPQGLFEFISNKFSSKEEYFDCELCYPDIYFSELIETNYKNGRSLEQLEYDIALDGYKWSFYLKYKNKPINCKWDDFRKGCTDIGVEFSIYVNSKIEESKKFLEQHPVCKLLGVMTLTLSGLTMGFWAMTLMSDKFNLRTRRKSIEISYENEHDPNYYNEDMEEEERPVVEIMDSGNPRQTKATRVRVECEDGVVVSSTSKKFKNFVEMQGCNDEVAHNLVTSIVRKNTYRLSFLLNGIEIQCGNVSFIKGWSLIMPYHYLVSIWSRTKDINCLMYLSQDNLHHVIQFPLKHILTGKDTIENTLCGTFELTKNCVTMTYGDGNILDCVMINLFKQMCHIHRDITKHFILKEEQGNLLGKTSGALVTYEVEGKDLVRTYQWMRDIKPNDETIEIVFPGIQGQEIRTYEQRNTYTYSAPTKKGDCGSIIGIYNHRLIRKLVGMHIAGDRSGNGYAIPLYKEKLDEYLSKFPIICQMFYECDQQFDDTKDVCLPSGQFIALGKCGSLVGQNSKTSLVKSKIYNKITKSIMRPAALKPVLVNGILINPLYKGLEKCGGLPIYLDMDILEECALDLQRIILTQYNNNIEISYYRRIMTYNESVEGCNDDFMSAICRSTSPGFPYMFNNMGHAGKSKWLGTDSNFNYDTIYGKQLRQDVEILIDNCRLGKITGVYCVDTLKDEKRLISKVINGKTRVFSACPQHFVIAFRKYFLGFAAWVMHNRIDNELAIGTNVYSYDWHRIAKRMQKKGNAIVAGDFSNFDGSLNSQIMWRILDIVNEWYDDGENNKLIRAGLWCHIVNSVHIKENDIYMWTHSQPSGNPFTTIINSMYNSIIKRMAWSDIMKPHKLSGMSHFNKYVSFISYGDDDIINISNTVLCHFNQNSLTKALEKLGHIYTDESKESGICKDYRSLSEIHFLKRSFRWCEELQRYVAPLQEEIIYEMINWTRNDFDPDEIMITNIETATREFVLHGKNYYDRFCNQLKTVRDLLPRQPMLGSYCRYILDIEANEEYGVENTIECDQV
nr:nonstructural polyprotein [Dicistroviridae sp.]